jgi:signal transduction histidine kinase
VKARNAFGIWSPAASLPIFEVDPYFYQKDWFFALCTGLLLCIILLGTHLRVRLLTGRIRAQTEARADERIAIARDLHDTLLQGIQGLLMVLHAAAERMDNDNMETHSIHRALAKAEDLVVEGRDRIKGLRTPGIGSPKLSDALQRFIEDIGCERLVTVHVEGTESDTLFGQPVAHELFMIAREALLNATSHSGASKVNIYLKYGAHAFCMECADDGLGIDNAARLTATSRPTYGLIGMKERASGIKAALEVSSSPGRGTVVSIRLPLSGSLASNPT